MIREFQLFRWAYIVLLCVLYLTIPYNISLVLDVLVFFSNTNSFLSTSSLPCSNLFVYRVLTLVSTRLFLINDIFCSRSNLCILIHSFCHSVFINTLGHGLADLANVLISTQSKCGWFIEVYLNVAFFDLSHRYRTQYWVTLTFDLFIQTSHQKCGVANN